MDVCEYWGQGEGVRGWVFEGAGVKRSWFGVFEYWSQRKRKLGDKCLKCWGPW